MSTPVADSRIAAAAPAPVSASSPTSIDRRWAPSLRGELIYVQRTEKTPGALIDPVINRRVNVGNISRSLIALLDGHRPLAEVLDRAAAEHPNVPRATVEHTFRTLLLMNLVSGAGREILDRVMAVRSGTVAFEPVFVEGSRFQCQGSGQCCQNYTFGPLASEDIERIRALDIVSVYPHLAGVPLFDEQPGESEGEPTRINLASVDGRCVFLQGDHRCGLHAAFGPESKPGFCNLYPIQPLPTIDGMKVFDRGECASFAASARSGPTLAEQYEKMRSYIGENFALQHPIVFLDDKTPCDYGHLLKLQRALTALVAPGVGRPGGGAALMAAGRMMRAFVDAISNCPLRRGEPDATVDALLERPALEFYDAPPAPKAPAKSPSPSSSEDPRFVGLGAVATIAGDLLRVVTAQIPRPRAASLPLLTPSLASEFAAAVHVLQALAAHRADPEGVSLLPHYQQVAACAAASPAVSEVLRISFRHTVFGNSLFIDERPVAGFLRMIFRYLFTLTAARLRATIDGARRIDLDHLSHGHMLAQRVLRGEAKSQVFLAHESLTWEVLDAVPQLMND